jgi:hypothetical protein
MENENNLREENIYRRSVLIRHKHKADENIVLKHVEQLVKTLTLSQSLFKDETFPPSSSSLYINGNQLSKTTLDLLPDQHSNHHIQWLRPDQIHPPIWKDNQIHQWTVYRNPKPNDVLQGALGLKKIFSILFLFSIFR